MTEQQRQLFQQRLDAVMQDLPITGAISSQDIRELVAKRPEEPDPVGHEFFEHLREEGA
jgi:hypothetical protein